LKNTQYDITGPLYHASLHQTLVLLRARPDYFLIKNKTRHPSQRATKNVYTVLKTSGLNIAKAKTSIGPIARGVDFLGDHFSNNALGVAKKNVSRMREKVLRLYKRGACVSRMEGTLTHGTRWLKAGLKGRIESSLKPLTLTIHSIQKQINVVTLICANGPAFWDGGDQIIVRSH
jgi:hypothetical protein